MQLRDEFPMDRPIRLRATTRDGAIRELVLELVKVDALSADRVDDCVKALVEREKYGSTGIGSGVAIPHARLPFSAEMMCSLGVSVKGLDWKALDGGPVFVVFLMLSGAKPSGRTLEALATVSRLVRDDPDFLHSLRDDHDPDMT